MQSSDHCCRVLNILAQAVVLALLITGLPIILGRSGPTDDINSLITSSAQLNDHKLQEADHGHVPLIHVPSMSVLFHDLANEGLYKHDHKIAFVLTSAGNVEATSNILTGPRHLGHVDFITPHRDDKATAYDFVFADSLRATGLLAAATKRLKEGGILAFQLGRDPIIPTYFVDNKPLSSHYNLVYFRRLLSGSVTYVAMKKVVDQSPMLQRRRLQSLDFPPTDHHDKTHDVEKKKVAALKKLEGVQLEEPRTTSRSYSMKKTRYLPDLLNDSLEKYPRRLFIDVGTPQDKDETSGTEWFKKNYPTRNKEFQLYHMEAMTIDDDDDHLKPYETTTTTEADDDDDDDGRREIGMTDWLKMNVNKEEYVVMKAEAEVVEELVKTKAIELVDELFMECKTTSPLKGRGSRTRGRGANNKKRAYWECLALYGRLRDLGVAVHQWWG